MSDPPTIGQYGAWAAWLLSEGPPQFSFRRSEFTDIDAWRTAARQRFFDRVAQPDTSATSDVIVHAQSTFNGLEVEELPWQLPYGKRTEAIFVKPAGATQPLPGVLALHDHGGNKYLGKRRIYAKADAQQATVALTILAHTNSI